jgi:curli biogenesis system outer membrane secretion channel CsgG
MLKYKMMLFVLISLIIATAVSAVGADDTNMPVNRVAVMNLKVSGEGSEQVREWLPAIIEDNLLKRGWTLVVRGERMQHIQEERNLPGVDPETKSEGNTLVGATAFLELTARVQISGVQGALGFGNVTIGDYVKASVDLNGQIVDVRTGLLKSSVKVGGSAGGLKTIAIAQLNRNWDISGGGINLPGIRETLVGKAADKAADRLVAKLDALYAADFPSKSKKLKSSTPSKIQVDKVSDATIFVELPNPESVKVGDLYGVYRDNKLVAELVIIGVVDKRAEARITSQTSSIRPTDKARKMPITISAE